MSISSITSTSAISSVQFQPTSTLQPATPDAGSADPTQVSKMGQFMSKLSSLEQSDPAKAKQVLSSIASKLNDAASSASGDEATHLKALADKFSKAADTGDLSGIQPPKGGHHHHHAAPPASTDDASGDSSASASDTAAKTAQTEKYKHHGAKPDMQQVEQIFDDAMSEVSA